MTKACNLINDSDKGWAEKQCNLERIAYICDCLKEGTNELTCVQNSKEKVNC